MRRIFKFWQDRVPLRVRLVVRPLYFTVLACLFVWQSSEPLAVAFGFLCGLGVGSAGYDLILKWHDGEDEDGH